MSYSLGTFCFTFRIHNESPALFFTEIPCIKPDYNIEFEIQHHVLISCTTLCTCLGKP